jgi:hypothetical protein
MACVEWNVWRKTEVTETPYLYSVYYEYHGLDSDAVKKHLIEFWKYPSDIELECGGNVEYDYDEYEDD